MIFPPISSCSLGQDSPHESTTTISEVKEPRYGQFVWFAWAERVVSLTGRARRVVLVAPHGPRALVMPESVDMKTPRWMTFLVGLFALCFLAGCGGSDDSASSASEPVDVANQTFVSDSVSGHDLVEGSQVQLVFEDDRLAVNGGCNTMSAAYTYDGRLVWDGPAISTQMACDQALMDQDQWLNSVFEAGVETSSDGADLVLTSGDVTMEFSKAGG